MLDAGCKMPNAQSLEIACRAYLPPVLEFRKCESAAEIHYLTFLLTFGCRQVQVQLLRVDLSGSHGGSAV